MSHRVKDEANLSNISIAPSRQPQKNPFRDFTRAGAYHRWNIAGLPYGIVMHTSAYKALMRHCARNVRREVGGILLGRLYTEQERDYIGITHYIDAEMANEQPMSLTFTNETWRKIDDEQQQLAPDALRVGWAHTHPSFGIFLSRPLDEYIQEQWFRERWQIALVVDPINEEAGFFMRDHNGRLPLDEPSIHFAIRTQPKVYPQQGHPPARSNNSSLPDPSPKRIRSGTRSEVSREDSAPGREQGAAASGNRPYNEQPVPTSVVAQNVGDPGTREDYLPRENQQRWQRAGMNEARHQHQGGRQQRTDPQQAPKIPQEDVSNPEQNILLTSFAVLVLVLCLLASIIIPVLVIFEIPGAVPMITIGENGDEAAILDSTFILATVYVIVCIFVLLGISFVRSSVRRGRRSGQGSEKPSYMKYEIQSLMMALRSDFIVAYIYTTVPTLVLMIVLVTISGTAIWLLVVPMLYVFNFLLLVSFRYLSTRRAG